MEMSSYLAVIEFAANNLIEIIWNERNQLTELEKEIAPLLKAVEDEYLKAQTLAMNAEDPDDVAMAAGIYWNNYFGDDKVLYHKDTSRQDLEDEVLAHEFSIAALCGALLQYAKQGISLVHSGLANCPEGRAIGSQHLKAVIWQSRNQAIHWEEGNFRKPVKDCFEALKSEINQQFDQYKARSMASDIVEILGWKTFDDFKADLSTLA